MTVILAIANHNGRVGKTVTAANVAAGFARAGRRTLAVDCDAQAHLTRWLLDPADQDAADLEAIVAGGADPAAAVHPTRLAGLDTLPATPRLTHISRVLAADSTLIARALGRLRPRYDAMVLDLPSSLSPLTVSALAAADGIVIPVPASPRLARIARPLAADGTRIARALGRLRPGYDAMVLDLPSSLGRLTVSALAAADGIVIPVPASVVGLRGLGGFRDWLASFRADRIITAPVWGVLLTQADLDEQGGMRTRVGRDVRDALADFRVTGARLLPVLVPRRVGVDDLVSQRLLLGDPAAHAGPGRDVVDAYARLVDYLLERVPAAAGPAAAGAAQ
ncbi:MAG TPA: AAA family ATPase [Actinomycetota bacterium]|nr:AAA family ATPase [Actinomycetota bacterium]